MHYQNTTSTVIENDAVDARTTNEGHQNLTTEHVSESQHLDLITYLITALSSTTATVPRRSIANRHVNRRLHICDNRKLRSSKLFERSGPSYTPYHMMAESRPLYLLLWLIRAPLRLQRRYHADPLLTGTSIVVSIYVTIANYAAASCLNDRGLPTHHTI
jgi:hypothetical protein